MEGNLVANVSESSRSTHAALSFLLLLSVIHGQLPSVRKPLQSPLMGKGVLLGTEAPDPRALWVTCSSLDM